MRVRSAISSPGTLEGHAIALAAYPMSLSKQLSDSSRSSNGFRSSQRTGLFTKYRARKETRHSEPSF
jgi:hypothetical protein